MTAGVFHLSGGQLVQAAGADLTVNGIRDDWSGTAFSWTGGNISTAANSASVQLQGATGTINPGYGNTISTGSTLSFESRSVSGVPQGSEVTFLLSAINLLGSATFYVSTESNVPVNTALANVVLNANAPPPTATIDGTWTVPGGKKNSLPVGLVVSGTVKVQARLYPGGEFWDGRICGDEWHGCGRDRDGSTLKVSSGVWIKTGGALNTTVLPNQADQRATPAVIDGNFHMSGGSVTLGSDSNPHVWSKLHVKGFGAWSGVINITIDNNAGTNKLDQLLFDGTFGNTVVLQGGQPVAGSPRFAISSVLPSAANQVWRGTLEATGGITPTGLLPSACVEFTIVEQPKVNGKVFKWDLQS